MTEAVTRENLPAVIDMARQRLADAKTSAEVLEGRRIADAAYHVSRVTKAGNEVTADCLVMISMAEMRLAQEIENGQARGQVAALGTNQHDLEGVPNGNTRPATYDDLGVSRKQVHDWKRTARAGEAVVRKAVSDQLDQGKMPTKADIRRAVDAVVPPAPPRDPEKLRALSEMATHPDFKLGARVDGSIREIARSLDGVDASEVIDLWSRQFIDPDGSLEAAVHRMAEFFGALKEFLDNGREV